MKRRDFLKLVGVASSGSILSGNAYGQSRKLIPYLIPPDPGVLPGIGTDFPSTCTECPAGCGILAHVRDKVIDDRHRLVPIKLEGNPNHPVNSGRLCARGQAALYRLYHPNRFRTPLLKKGDSFQPVSWEDAFRLLLASWQRSRSEGRKNVMLTGLSTGSLDSLLDEVCSAAAFERLPEYEPYSHASLWRAYETVFGIRAIPDYRIEKADVLISIGADLIETFVNPVAFARRIAEARGNSQFRWYHLEPHVSLTGFAADRRLVLRPASEIWLVAYLLHHIHRTGRARKPLPASVLSRIPEISRDRLLQLTGLQAEALEQLVADIQRAQSLLVVAGGVSAATPSGPSLVALTALLQWCTGQIGETVDVDRVYPAAHLGTAEDTRRWLDALSRNEIGVQWISRCDPVGTLPNEWKADELMSQALLTVVLADLPNPTSQAADIILPVSHSLETWGDASPRADVWSLIQPTTEPIGDTRSEGDILLELQRVTAGAAVALTYEQYLRDHWERRFGERTATLLREGVIQSDPETTRIRLRTDKIMQLLASFGFPTPQPVVLYIAPSVRGYDGRSRALPLLQEIPDPLTSISYGEWISVSTELANRVGLRDGEVARVTADHWSAELAVRVQPGLPEDVTVVQRDVIRGYPTGAMNDAGELLSYVGGVVIEPAGKRARTLAVLAGSTDEKGRGIVPRFSATEREHDAAEQPTDMYPPHEHKDYRWAMAIDLGACTGCSACVAACYIENNVPVVGPEEHRRGREMAWLRIEPYYHAEEAEFVPMLCQQCDNAPCEPVCPVYATYHNPEGLNAQIYNRCVGTRYCSNNCPYKVRRFNWFDHEWPRPLDWMLNPDLSTRGRGVMEKCTFCIQRIRRAKDKAKDEGRKVRDGEILPACAQTCPSGAIVFGNLLDPDSEVSKLARSGRAYRILEHLNTKPAVWYLRKKTT